MPRMATTVLIKIGRKVISAAISSFERRPGPDQRMISGATAMIGTAWLAASTGARARSIQGILAST